ncbi:MAG: DUF58 domain-containing protein [Synergistaceae bacterium]|jgi:uncharacterized protein (DUF58 family)|nr:DUF58 domain-containing protein [Synergistaceae bacterium]
MKRLIRVRRAGIVYIIALIVMCLLAFYGGNNLHYLAASVLAGYFCASGLAGRGNLFGAGVSLSFPDEIYANAPFLLTIEVSNNKRRAPIYLIDVRVGGAKMFFPVIMPGERRSESAVLSFPSRGLHMPGEVEISSPYPFNFFTRYRQMEQDGPVLVFPRQAGRGDEAVFVKTGEEDVSNDAWRPIAETDIMGVRPYVEGDPMKFIHWKSSARTGRLNTRLYDGSSDGAGRSGRIIDLDGMVPSGLERALSIASREIARSLESGDAIGMMDGGRLTEPVSSRADKLSMLAGLALHEDIDIP